MRLLAPRAPRWRRLLVAALLPALGACPQSPGLVPYPTTFDGAPFSQAELAGDWAYAAIFHGSSVAAGTSRGWERGTVRVSTGGDVTVVFAAASDGTALSTVPTPWLIDANGFVTTPPGQYVGFDLKVNAARDLAAATGTRAGPSGTVAFWILHRVEASISFAGADLAGSTWAYHRLITGASPSWEHGVATFGADLVLSTSGRVAQGGTQPDQASVGKAGVDASGGVTLDSDATWLGWLSADKGLLVATRTVGSGMFALEVYARQGQSFKLSDLTGRVSSHIILAAPGGAWGWSHGVFTVNADGLLSWEAWLTNAGQTTLPPSVAVVLAPDGTTTAPSVPTLHSTQLWSRDGSVRTATTDTGTVYSSFAFNVR